MENIKLPSMCYLDSKHIEYKVLHLTTRASSVQDVKRLYGCSLKQILKTLVLISNKEPVVAVVQGNKEVSLENIKALFNLSILRFATPKEVQDSTGYVIGGVSPFGLPENVKKVIDTPVFDEPLVNMGGGTPFIGLELSSDNLRKAWDGYIDTISVL